MDLAATIENAMLKELELLMPSHSVKEVYHYALFPTGKLVRSQLFIHLFHDLGGKDNEDMLKIACFLEFHHAYTLIHDDLPCMDDDDERRGKASTHRAFGEWQALLAGDGLQNLSFGVLAKMKSQRLRSFLRFATWATGPKGLIHGQVMDLSQEMNQSLSKLTLTHELKTARLFQLSTLFAYYLSVENKAAEMKKIREFMNLGKYLGITFQFLDDLSDLSIEQLSQHEKEVNPFLRDPMGSLEILKNTQNRLMKRLEAFPQSKKFLTEIYFSRSYEKLNQGKSTLLKRGINLDLIFLA